jgi:murein DD-endopeptidase MepM/ murein hydrolase activator NlpD
MSKLKLVLLAIWFFVFFVLFLEQHILIPVQDASSDDWNQNSFWYEPWGESGVHKGIDIFAHKGSPALAAVSGLVIYRDELKMGGQVIIILGPKWRLHYYAHLGSVKVRFGQWVLRGQKVGEVGNTGNAIGRPTHLHYSIMSLIPYPNRYSSETQGWKRMFYLNPDEVLR